MDVEMEKRKFLNLCGKRDQALLSGEKRMTLGDMERLTYLTEFFELENYGIALWKEFGDDVKEPFEAMMKMLDEPECIEDRWLDDEAKGEKWLLEFQELALTALLIGGGIGVPPLVETAKQLAAKGVEVVSVLGFATKDAVILEEELSAYGKVYVTTDDGSYGIKGYVSTVVDDLVEKQSFDAIYSCGAPGMLKYVDKKFENHPHAYLSMESRMACGMGACYACVVHLRNAKEAANKRVCEDGPVFETGQIIL